MEQSRKNRSFKRETLKWFKEWFTILFIAEIIFIILFVL